jgi:hypothetical protein
VTDEVALIGKMADVIFSTEVRLSPGTKKFFNADKLLGCLNGVEWPGNVECRKLEARFYLE